MLDVNIPKIGEHMLSKKGKEHNLIVNKQSFLSPLQKKILLFFAVTRPQTIREAVTEMKGNYRSSWEAFKELKKKNLIEPIRQKFYRGRIFPRFWLTERGVILALSKKTNPEILLRKTQEIYPENRNLQFLIETIPLLGENAYHMLYLSVVTNGEIKERDLIPIFAMQRKLSKEENKKFKSILKRYPERYNQTKDAIKRASQNLKDLSDMFGV